jgi:hypothetical protein
MAAVHAPSRGTCLVPIECPWGHGAQEVPIECLLTLMIEGPIDSRPIEARIGRLMQSGLIGRLWSAERGLECRLSGYEVFMRAYGYPTEGTTECLLCL